MEIAQFSPPPSLSSPVEGSSRQREREGREEEGEEEEEEKEEEEEEERGALIKEWVEGSGERGRRKIFRYRVKEKVFKNVI